MEIVIKPKKPFKLISIDPMEARKLLKVMSVDELAKQIGCSYSGLSLFLKNNHITAPKKIRKVK